MTRNNPNTAWWDTDSNGELISYDSEGLVWAWGVPAADVLGTEAYLQMLDKIEVVDPAINLGQDEKEEK